MRESLGIIAGSSRYPVELAQSALALGVKRIVVAAFEGETDPAMAELAAEITWMRVGQLGKLIGCFRDAGIGEAIMAGQIAPKNLFDLRPDFKALLLLGKLKRRNAESIFGAIADELENAGVRLLPATTYLDHLLAAPGHIAGPAPKKREIEDARFGLAMAQEMARLDVGQTVVVKNGTVLAVEAFEGTNEAITRGGALGRGGAVVAKVSKPSQDFRFDVPVIGAKTLEIAASAGVRMIAVEAGKTLVLDREQVEGIARVSKVTVYAEQL